MKGVAMKCFYHSADLDGHCSGAIVKFFNTECELLPINYGDIFPWEKIKKDETVYMVDFSLQPFSEMLRLNEICNLIWIDHHISAIKEQTESGVKFDGALMSGIGACFLTWGFFSTGPVPYPVRLLAEYDVWDHRDKNTLPFQYGLRMEETRPNKNMDLWESLFNMPTSPARLYSIRDTGNIILSYEKKQNEIYCSSCAFETTIDGYKCVSINRMLTNSKMFDSVWDSSKYDIMMTFGFRNGAWTVSLYTDKKDVDVSVIAKRFGGGGHKQAAGFQCSELPFKVK